MGKTVLVTGGSGLVGQGLRTWAETKGNPEDKFVFLSSKDGDLRKKEDVDALFDKHKPTHVVHLAAFVGGLFHNMRYKVEFFRHNSSMNENILAACKEFNVVKCVSCLSTCIFPDKHTRSDTPIDETMLHDGAPHPSNEGYAYAKRMVDVLSRAYREEYGCNFVTVIPTNLFGHHDNFNIEEGHVLPGLMHKIYLAKKNNTPFVVYGTGKPLRQFMYNNDMGALLAWTLDNYDEADPIILSVDESAELSIGEAAQIVAAKMGFTGEIQYDTTKADGQYKKTASNSKLRRLYPDFQFTPFDKAVEETVQWFTENYDTARK